MCVGDILNKFPDDPMAEFMLKTWKLKTWKLKTWKLKTWKVSAMQGRNQR
jgi:hypothetical protein